MKQCKMHHRPVLKESETDFSTWIEDLLTRFHWRWAHSRPAKTEKGWRTPVSGDGAGWPDYFALSELTIHGYRRQMVVELKAEDGDVSDAQRIWLDWLSETEYPECYLVRPSDRDEFQQILTLGHTPSVVEIESFACAWVNRR